jgi:hypothetical protein
MMFISEYIQQLVIEREVPVWESFARSFARLQRKYVCFHRIPKWDVVFTLGPVRAHVGTKKTGSPKQLEEPVRIVVVALAGHWR